MPIPLARDVISAAVSGRAARQPARNSLWPRRNHQAKEACGGIQTTQARGGRSRSRRGDRGGAGRNGVGIPGVGKDGGKTSTLAYEITITVQGAPDQLVCDPADNGGFLISGSCVLPDAVIGLSYQGHLLTSHKAGGTLSVVSGSLPPGLSLPATFTGSGDTVGGTPADPSVVPGRNFTVQGTATRATPCTRPTRST
jgi:hypothetical protein